MEVYFKHDIFKDDFILQRNIALRTIQSTKVFREITAWDRVGSYSNLPHDKRVMKWIHRCIGNFEVVNKCRHFNSCMKNPYNFAHVHYDDYDYILIIYLNLPQQYDPRIDGTEICRRKKDGKTKMDKQTFDEIEHYYKGFEYTDNFDDVYFQESVFWKSDYMKDEKWDTQMFVPMKANKAFMFEARYLHRETRNFGNCLLGSRLVEVVYVKRTT